MFGPEGVVAAIVGCLRRDLPGKLAEMRVRYGVADDSLADIDRYLVTEPENVAVDRPPMIVVAEQGSDTLDGPRRVATDGSGGSIYEWRYRITIFAWATGQTFESTARTRQRYGLAVREVLLSRPGLGDPDVGTCVLDPLRIEETYSDVARDGQSREVLAATAVLVEYRTQESLSARVPGLVNVGVDTGIGLVP